MNSFFSPIFPAHLLVLIFLSAFGPKNPATEMIGAEADILFSLVNNYRASRGQAKVPYSAALTQVAEAHVKDLSQRGFSGESLHSWADCAFSAENPACMWEKPRQLTTYPGVGYEIVQYNGYGATAREALAGWINSPGHHAIMANLGSWRTYNWQAMGVAISGKFACVWFGEKPDETRALDD